MASWHLFISMVLLLLVAGLTCTESSKGSGNATSKKKSKPAKLSANIDENPFLKDRITTTSLHANYQGNPFLSVTPKSHVVFGIGNGSQFLPQSGLNGNPNIVKGTYDAHIDQSPAHTVYTNTPSTNPSNAQNPVKGLSISDNLSVQTNVDATTKTKSEYKCEEYGRQISGTTEILSLVGTNTEVIKLRNENCGEPNRLVVGGTLAVPGEFPHMVALGRRTGNGNFLFYCGGTLISPEWVLSAAHCTYGPNGSPTVARIGFHSLSSNHAGIVIGISRIVRHPSYRPPAMYADIALLKLESIVNFNRLIRPACLYQQYDTVPTKAWVSGWGVTEFGGEESDQLQKALLDIVDNIACTIRHNRSIAVPHGITPSMICAGDPRGGWKKDTCQGDSGGPLQVIHPKNVCLFQVIGITSFGEGCAIVNSPGVYTRVSHYLNWIEDTVWPDSS